MQKTTLHTKLRAMTELGIISIKFEPEKGHVFPGEGSYYYNDEPVKIVPDFVGRSPDGSDVSWTTPHDIAFAPKQNQLLAWADAAPEPFQIMPTELRAMVSRYKKKVGKT